MPPVDQSLFDELSSFSPADSKEASDLREMLELIHSPGSSLRSHFEPGHFTASAFIVHPPTSRLLLHHHRRLDRWLQMGGHLGPDETPSVAALREASEESGLTDVRLLDSRIFDIDVHLIPSGKGEPQHRHFDVRYVAVSDSPDAIRADPVESMDLCWFSFDAAASLMDEDCSRRAIGKIRSRLAQALHSPRQNPAPENR
ncbi:MAG: NUDIX domain-containing protein [Acidobacteriota bacterium]